MSYHGWPPARPQTDLFQSKIKNLLNGAIMTKFHDRYIIIPTDVVFLKTIDSEPFVQPTANDRTSAGPHSALLF